MGGHCLGAREGQGRVLPVRSILIALAILFATASLKPVHNETVPSRHHIDATVPTSVFLLTGEDENKDCQLHGFISRLTQILKHLS